ncbi:NACHT domain-containing protein [Longimicrobium sp.]|uniref:NACHT domain-containing protein n=1 Tax=Longimicrobium sp. TaxID=2029185 RepID=UPI003B3A4815
MPLAADPARQAVSTLRGYSYQIWRTLAAWFQLRPGEELYIEGAEDFDVLRAGGGRTVQVKDLSRSVTLASKDVAEAIFHCWEHLHRNPDRDLQFHFLTTAGRGRERSNPFKGEKGLDVWDACRRPDTDLRPLRDFLGTQAWPVPSNDAEREALATVLSDFLRLASDEDVRERLIRRIHWDTGSDLQDAIEQTIKDHAITHGARFHYLPPWESTRVVPSLLQHVWEVACQPAGRRLTYPDLLRVFESATTVAVSRAQFERINAQTTLDGPAAAGGGVGGFVGHDSFSGWRRDVRGYLKKLVETMRERNHTWSTGTFDPYIDLAAEPQDDLSPGWREYPRERGHVVSFPQIRPTVARVMGAARPSGSMMASDAVGLQTKTVRSVLRELGSRPDPVVLLGEPGSGKSTTLRELVIQLAQRALTIPGAPVPIYVELGAFRERVDRNPGEAVIDLIRQSIPAGVSSLRRRLNLGAISVPIVVVFDAMDEMPRSGDYAARTAALATFAAEYVYVARTVFACRTNDFDPSFGHRQLVIKPFDEPRIRLFLRKTLGRHFEVGGEVQTPRSATRRLLRPDELGSDAGNPLTLSLAIEFIIKRREWPRGRASLFEDHIVALADRALARSREASSDALLRETVDAWAGLAYEIFSRDGAVVMERDFVEARVGDTVVERAVGGGLVVEDPETRLLKFRHHRLQEFLVARRLRLPDPPQPDWAASLASPRWQETLLNYFAIGGHNDGALQVVLDTLGPAERYFARLRPLVDRAEKDAAKARRAYDAVKPDIVQSAGEYASYSYSPAQQARKDAAQKRLDTLRGRHKRLRTLSLERETTWSDHVLFAARLSALLNPSSPEAEGLRRPLQGSMTGLLDFGRPAAQVRMLSAWREIADWCPATVLDPVRDSPLHWVRSQAIHALVSTPLDRDRIDHAFSEELEWELLNLRLPGKLRVFWETAALRPHRRLQVVFALLLHLMFVVIVLGALAAGGMRVVPKLGSFAAFAGVNSALLWVGWIGVVGTAAVLTVPVLRWTLLVRVAAANAITVGIALAVSWPSATIFDAPGEPSWADSLGSLGLLAQAAGPVLVTSAALLLLLAADRLLFRMVAYGWNPGAGSSRKISSSEAFLPALWMAAGACVFATGGAFFVLFRSPAGKYVGWGLAGIMILFCVAIAFILIREMLDERWKAHRGKRVPVRIALIIKEIVLFVCVAGLVIGILCGIDAGLSILGRLLFEGLVPEWLAELFLGIVSGILILSFGVALLVLVAVYVRSAFGRTASEIRFLLMRGRLRRRPYRGSLGEWEAAFHGASQLVRRELLESFDHRAMAVAPQDALRTLLRLEGLVEVDDPAADIFHKTMYQVQEAARQQRWTDPSGLTATGDVQP